MQPFPAEPDETKLHTKHKHKNRNKHRPMNSEPEAVERVEPPSGYVIRGTSVQLPNGEWIEAQRLAETDVRHEGDDPVLAAWLHATSAWQAAALGAGFELAPAWRLEARAAIRDDAVIVYVYEEGAANVRGGTAGQRHATLSRLRELGLCKGGYGARAAGLRWLPVGSRGGEAVDADVPRGLTRAEARHAAWLDCIRRQHPTLDLDPTDDPRGCPLDRLALGRATGVTPPSGQKAVPQNTCNRHTDCAAADHRAKAQNCPAVHCYTEGCEDCFGT